LGQQAKDICGAGTAAFFKEILRCGVRTKFPNTVQYANNYFSIPIISNKEWIFLNGTGAGAGVIFKDSGFKILIVIYAVRKLW